MKYLQQSCTRRQLNQAPTGDLRPAPASNASVMVNTAINIA
jgi:hypothetical protein